MHPQQLNDIMRDLAAVGSLVLGCLYYLVKYKFLLGTTRNLFYRVITSVSFIVVLTLYVLYIKFDNKISAWLITTSLLTCVGGITFDMAIDVYPERGSWASLLTLLYIIIETKQVYGTNSILFIVGCILFGASITTYGISRELRVFFPRKPSHVGEQKH